jgi:hypothetical protein
MLHSGVNIFVVVVVVVVADCNGGPVSSSPVQEQCITLSYLYPALANNLLTPLAVVITVRTYIEPYHFNFSHEFVTLVHVHIHVSEIFQTQEFGIKINRLARFSLHSNTCMLLFLLL